MISTNVVRERNSVFNNITNDWYTPKFLIDSVRVVLGDIDIDPATSLDAQEWIQAKQFYTKETNGYDKPWYGRVFLNPPYGIANGRGSASLWLQKLFDEYNAGNTTAAIAIVNTATHNKWYSMVYAYPIVQTHGPLSFIQGNPDSNSTHNMYGSTFVYLGNDIDTFVREFSKYGTALRKVT